MYYNDDETKKAEEVFQKNLIAAREYIEKNKQRIDEQTVYISTVLMPILQKEYKTPEEIELLFSSEAAVLETQNKLRELKSLLGESLERQAISFYQYIKQKALEGDEEANEIYLDLKPDYEQLLNSKLNGN